MVYISISFFVFGTNVVFWGHLSIDKHFRLFRTLSHREWFLNVFRRDFPADYFFKILNPRFSISRVNVTFYLSLSLFIRSGDLGNFFDSFLHQELMREFFLVITFFWKFWNFPFLDSPSYFQELLRLLKFYALDALCYSFMAFEESKNVMWPSSTDRTKIFNQDLNR